MPSTVEALLRRAADLAIDYRHATPSARAYPDDEALAALEAFDAPLPEHGDDATTNLELLARTGGAATVRTTGGRYFGFVNGGCHPAALAARWLADAWDQNAALQVMSPLAAKLESICEGWPQNTGLALAGKDLVGGFIDRAADFFTGVLGHLDETLSLARGMSFTRITGGLAIIVSLAFINAITFHHGLSTGAGSQYGGRGKH